MSTGDAKERDAIFKRDQRLRERSELFVAYENIAHTGVKPLTAYAQEPGAAPPGRHLKP